MVPRGRILAGRSESMNALSLSIENRFSDQVDFFGLVRVDVFADELSGEAHSARDVLVVEELGKNVRPTSLKTGKTIVHTRRDPVELYLYRLVLDIRERRGLGALQPLHRHHRPLL